MPKTPVMHICNATEYVRTLSGINLMMMMMMMMMMNYLKLSSLEFGHFWLQYTYYYAVLFATLVKESQMAPLQDYGEEMEKQSNQLINKSI